MEALGASLRRRSFLSSRSDGGQYKLSSESRQYVDQFLSGPAGERLVLTLTLIVRFKKLLQSRRRLTQVSQPSAVKGEFQTQTILQLLRSIPSLWMLRDLPDDLLATVQKSLVARTYKPGETLVYPKESFETAGVFFVLRGSVAVRKAEVAPVVRFADDVSQRANSAGSPRRGEGSSPLEEFAAPCIYGAVEAAAAAFHPNCFLVANPALPVTSVVDTLFLPGRVFHRFLVEISTQGQQLPASPKKESDNPFEDQSTADQTKRQHAPQRVAAASKDLAAQIGRLRVTTIQVQFPLTQELLQLSWLFQKLTPAEAHVLIEIAKAESWEAGETIVHCGSKRRKWFFLRRGTLVCTPRDPKRQPFDMLPGCSFGEFSIIYGEPCEHSIRARTICDLWTIDGRDAAVALMHADELRQRLQNRVSLLRTRVMNADRSALPQMLLSTPYVTHSSPPELVEMLTQALKPVVVPQRTILASSSVMCDRMFLIAKGSLQALRTDYCPTFGPGSVIGSAVAFAHRWPYPVVTTTIVDAWEVTRSELLDVGRRMDYLVALQGQLHDSSALAEETARVVGREWTGSTSSTKPHSDAPFSLPPGYDSYVKFFFGVAKTLLHEQAMILPSSVTLKQFLSEPRVRRSSSPKTTTLQRVPTIASRRTNSATSRLQKRELDTKTPLVVTLREPVFAVDSNFIQQLVRQQVRNYRPTASPARDQLVSSQSFPGAALDSMQSGASFEDDEWERPRSERSNTSIRQSTVSGEGSNGGKQADTIVAPDGFYQWESDVKSLFAMDSVPNLMLLHHNVRARGDRGKKKEHGETRSRVGKDAVDPWHFESPSDSLLPQCIAPGDPDICLGLEAHRKARSIFAQSPSSATMRYTFSPNGTAEKAPGEKATPSDRSRLLLQMFRAGAFSPKKERTRKAVTASSMSMHESQNREDASTAAAPIPALKEQSHRPSQLRSSVFIGEGSNTEEDSMRRKSTKVFDLSSGYRAALDARPTLEKYITSLNLKLGCSGHPHDRRSSHSELASSAAASSVGPDNGTDDTDASTPRTCASPALSDLSPSEKDADVDPGACGLEERTQGTDAVSLAKDIPASVGEVVPFASDNRGSLFVEGYGDVPIGVPIDNVQLFPIGADPFIEGRRSPRRHDRRRAPTDPQTVSVCEVRQPAAGALMKFPDAAETAAMIRMLETHSEAREVAFSRSKAIDEEPLLALIPKRLPDVDAMLERLASGQGGRYQHAVLPREIEWDAGPNLLEAALEERVAVSELEKKLRRGSLAEEADDSSGDDEPDDGGLRTVLVGSRQFGFTPKPLRKAVPSERDEEYWKAQEALRAQATIFGEFLAAQPFAESSAPDGGGEAPKPYAPRAPHRRSSVGSFSRKAARGSAM
jgi:CRP-like cAMP-binding protein